MERPEFLEFVLGKQSPVVIETWDITKVGPGRVNRFTVDFDRAATENFPPNTFFLPQNGTIMSIMSDTDDREPALPPSVVTETDMGRRNSTWRFSAPLNRSEASLMLNYLDPLSPPRMTDTYRLPGTVSTKHGSPFTCRVIEASEKIYTAAQVFGLQEPEEPIVGVDPAWIREPGPFAAGKALTWMQRKSNPVPRSVRIMMEKQETTPRKLIISLIRSGLTEREAIWCAEAAACNPYKDWVYGVREELAKILLISRSQSGSAAIANQVTRIRSDKADKSKPFVIRNKMSTAAMADFEKNCTVLRATDGGRWAIDKRSGTALELVHGSEPIKHFISKRYGINPVDVDHRHLLEEMIAMAAARPNTAEATSISHYQSTSNRMFVSFGGRELAVLTKNGMEMQENGSDGIIFRPVPGADTLASKLLPVDRMLQEPAGSWWERVMPLEMLSNVVRGEPEQLSTMLHIWTVFFMFRNIAASRPILACLGPAGCLATDTPVTIRRGKRNSGRTYSIAKAYEYTHGGKNWSRTWDPTLPTEILSHKDGKIRYRKIKRFISSGEKETYTVMIQGHTPFRATLDHRFLTEEGWLRLGQLSVGDLVCVTQKKETKGKRTVHHPRRDVKARFHPHARQHIVSWKNADGETKSRVYPSIPYAWAVAEARLNDLTVEEFLSIVQTAKEEAKTLQYLPEGTSVHHKDEDPTNDSEDNLIALTKAEHDALHGDDNTRNFGNHLLVGTAAVVSIERYGIEPTYDIEMEDGEAPNFLVNDVIVHNSGKTTLSKKLHLLFYGKGVKLFQIGSHNDWATTTSNYPLTLFDNVDTPTPWWLPPALAISISPTDATKRTLYSNNTPYVQRMDAMVGLSSHDAAFLKDDVIDRMILLQFSRIPNEDRFQEEPMMEAILHDREELLGGLMADVVRVLNTPRPKAVRGSAIRIVDFMAIGQWIARALGKERAFMESLGSLSVHQTAKVLEEDIGLVTALEELQRISPIATEWVTHTQIWNEIIQLSEDNGDALKQQYKNQQIFGRKLLAIFTQLRDTLGIEEKDDARYGWKTWRLLDPAKPKPTLTHEPKP